MIWLFVLWFIAMVFGIALIILVFISGVKNFEKNKEKKKRKKRINCIKKTTGTIVESKQNDAHSPLILKVQFQVDNEIYQFEEKALLAIEKREWKGITVSKKGHYPFDTHVGSIVEIKYDPKDPYNAYIVDNTGNYRKK